MMLRTESDFIRAVDMARDLTSLVMQFLDLWGKHANGVRGITVPNYGEYRVVFISPEENHINFELINAESHSTEKPVYYDTDSDYFSESWAASNISGYTSEHWIEIVQCNIRISIGLLAQGPEKMKASIIKMAADEKLAKIEAERLQKLASLQQQIDALQKGVP